MATTDIAENPPEAAELERPKLITEYGDHAVILPAAEALERFAPDWGRWVPDPESERCPLNADIRTLPENGWRVADFVDLTKLTPGSVVLFTGQHPHAVYTLKTMPDGMVKVWRDRFVGNTTGLVTETNQIVVSDGVAQRFRLPNHADYPGCLIAAQVGTIPSITMPYFRYKQDEVGPGSVALVEAPDLEDSWSDVVQYITVKEAES